VDHQDLPLFHIDGKTNIVDLLTKHNQITPTDIGIGSNWQNGLPWMTLPISQMPITTYSDLKLSSDDLATIDEECFPEPILATQQSGFHFVNAMHIGENDSTHCD